MVVTAINITKVEPNNTKMRGVATVVLDDMIAVHDIKILQGQEKWFLAMPSKKTKVGDFKDITHPIHVDVRSAFELLLFEGYEKAEKQGFSRLQMIYNNTGKLDLTKQTVEDFSICGA